MSPIAPKRIGAPILLGGPHAEEFLAGAQTLGFSGTTVASSELGKAAATKMCRSVIVKGMEALLLESMLSARHYGVESAVLESLQDLFPGIDWPVYARYMISRTLEHGTRRAEEMREVTVAVAEAGITPRMSPACSELQAWAPGFAEALEQPELLPMLDHILTQLHAESDRSTTA